MPWYVICLGKSRDEQFGAIGLRFGAGFRIEADDIGNKPLVSPRRSRSRSLSTSTSRGYRGDMEPRRGHDDLYGVFF